MPLGEQRSVVVVQLDEEIGFVSEKGRLGKDGVGSVTCDEVHKCGRVESTND